MRPVPWYRIVVAADIGDNCFSVVQECEILHTLLSCTGGVLQITAQEHVLGHYFRDGLRFRGREGHGAPGGGFSTCEGLLLSFARIRSEHVLRKISA